MASPERWRLARRLALLAANSPVRGIRRADAAAELGVPFARLWDVAGPAYGAGLVDVIGDWFVAPGTRKAADTRPAALSSPLF